MTFDEATQKLLELTLSALLGAGVDTVVLDNEHHDPTSRAPWTRVSVLHRDAKQVTMGPPGSRRFKYWGFVRVRSYVRPDSGTAPAAVPLVDAFSGLAGLRPAGTLVLGTPVVAEGERDGAWHVSVVNIPFDYEAVL